MKKEHHYMLWGIVIILAILGYMHYKRQMLVMSNVNSNTGGGIVTPGVPAN